MSLIKKSDVKNHLSARRGARIHLPTASQADATGFPHEEPTAADSGENDAIQNPLSPSPSGEQKTAAIVPPKSAQN